MKDPTLADYNPYKDFTTLEAWKKARILKLFFYNEIIPLLPAEEKFNLNVQIRKASVSSTANISEGYGRYNDQKSIQFYRMSRASMYELKDHLISCYDFRYIMISKNGLRLLEEAKATFPPHSLLKLSTGFATAD